VQIIDSQVHIWAENTPERPWAPNMEGRAHLPEPLTAEKLAGMMDGAGVDAAILVPPSLEGDRNDLALAAAQRYPGRFAVMGRIDFTKPQARAALTTWRDQPGMLGVRLTFHRPDTRAKLTDRSADWLWASAERHNIPLMVLRPTACRRSIKSPGVTPG
jgi:predicted TIM-barrel fold metal-dependent hydrolase